jgi:Fe-S cluster biogenesis protein NfuA
MAEPGTRLDDAAVHERLARLDELLAQVETIPGPAGELALDAVSTLAQVYGEALIRAVEYTSAEPDLRDALTGDELLGHLLVLHGIHPHPVGRRVVDAIAQLRPAVQERGGDVELAGIEHGVATVRLSMKGCGSSSAGIEDAIRDAVLATAPELSDVELVPVSGGGAAFVPLEALMPPPVTSGVGPP